MYNFREVCNLQEVGNLAVVSQIVRKEQEQIAQIVGFCIPHADY
jgi:hypothetical protein